MLLTLLVIPFMLLPAHVPQVMTQHRQPVKGPAVIFFSPNMTERDSTIHADGPEAAELLDDFDYSAGKVSSFLRMRGIGVELTSQPVILLKIGEKSVRAFERSRLGDYLGVILTDGTREPRVLPGLLTDEELIAEVTEFFRLQ